MDRAPEPAQASLERDIIEMLAVDLSDTLPAWLGRRIELRSPRARCRVLQVHPINVARVKGLTAAQLFCVSDAGDVEAELRAIGGDALLVAALHELRALEQAVPGGGYRYLMVMHALEEPRYVIEVTSPAEEGPSAAVRQLANVGNAYFDRLAALETDPLTKLRTRRVFHAHIEAGIRNWTRSGHAHCLAMLDIDHFKRVNDDFGHLYGDEILVHFANLMRRTFRAGDLLYRFGGEEFVAVYGAEDDPAGTSALERFREAVEKYPFPGVGRITVSIGFSQIRDPSTPAAILVDRADQAVYVAKSLGRNRVCGWEQLVAAGILREKGAGGKDVTLF